MRFLWAVAAVSVGCFSKPDFAGSGPRPDASSDASIDGAPLPPCAWREISNLVTYLPLDEPVGANKVMDSSDAMNGGTPIGPTVLGTEGRIAAAASFLDGGNARIEP